jgi:4-amino-4-deoxy-L-arabinose transferase-like glycosyltransferase
VLNAAAWAILLPPLQAHDEQAHVYYAQYLAETGKVPKPIGQEGRSPEQRALEEGVRLFDVFGNTNGRPPWTDAERDALDRQLSSGLSRVSPVASDEGVGSYPPLYYALVAGPYKAASAASGTLTDRIVAMRFASALLAGVTVLFVFLFLRELLPRDRWLWTVGALAVALQPVFAFSAGSVNPDNGLAAASAVTFYLLARAFRRGLTPRLAGVIGLVLAAGILAKITMVAFVPGVALALLLLAWRAHRRDGLDATALRALAVAAVAFAVPMIVYCVLNTTVWGRPLLPGGAGGGVAVTTGSRAPGSLGGLLSYAWQDYLPRLGFMQDWFHGTFNAREVWFRTFWGVFGWGDYFFSPTTLDVLLALSLLVTVGAGVTAFRSRRALRRRLDEIAVYLALALGLLALLAYVGYGYRLQTGFGFEQGRYLLPLMAPFALWMALGVRAAGPRIGRIAGVLVVTGSLGLTFYAHLLTVARFYA